MGVIFLLWLPTLLTSWTGVYVIDNVFQFQWFKEGNISAHHPILHTYLLGFCMEAGKKSLILTKPGLECILWDRCWPFPGSFHIQSMHWAGDWMEFSVWRAFCFMRVCLIMRCLPLLPQNIFCFPDSFWFFSWNLMSWQWTQRLFSSKKRIIQYMPSFFGHAVSGIRESMFSCVWSLFCCFWEENIGRRLFWLALVPVLLREAYTGPLYQVLNTEYRKRKFRGNPLRSYAVDIPGNPRRRG